VQYVKEEARQRVGPRDVSEFPGRMTILREG